MKKILLLLLLLAGSVSAQDVIIPDANFKTALLASNTEAGVALDAAGAHIIVDINGDSEISYTEALAVYSLDLMGLGMNSIQGIEKFTNITYLRCRTNNLTSVDLSQNLSLKKLILDENQLTSLDVSMLVNLEWLIVSSNFLTSLNVVPLIHLTALDFRYNQLTTIDVSTLSELYSLDASHNNITNIDLHGLNTLKQLVLQYNNISAIDFSPLPADIDVIYIGLNHLASADISMLTGIRIFDASWNELTTLDCSHNTALNFVGCSNNQMQTLFIKNGSIEGNFNNQYVFANNPNLQYICADDDQIQSIQDELNLAGITTTLVSSYCSFVPGGNYNTISGTVLFDSNNNGCDSNDVPPVYMNMNLTDGNINGNAAINGSGNYVFYPGTGNFTLTPRLEMPAYFSVSPTSATTSFAAMNSSVFNQDFCVTPNGVHPDLEIVIAPIEMPRPGFNASYKIVYRNKGTETQSGLISFSYDGTLMEFLDSTVVPDAFSPGFIGYNFTTLQPFESREIYIVFNINAPIDTPPVNNGDQLAFTASIAAIPAADEYIEDNAFQLVQTVIGSFDPNDKTCLEGSTVSPSQIGKYLHYQINFENTGTAPAENIVVKDEIDETMFDISTLQLIESSHPVRMRITGNVVEFIFEGIFLEPSDADRATVIGGHGNVLFKIKTRPTLVTGDTVSNKANIYFDYNFPVETEPANTTFALLKNDIFVSDNSIGIYPNPAKNTVNIEAKTNIRTVALYDVQGRVLQTIVDNKNTVSLDVSDKPKGIYFLKITTETGSIVEKLVKE